MRISVFAIVMLLAPLAAGEIAFMALNPNAVPLPGIINGPAGHVCCGFQLDDGTFELVSFGPEAGNNGFTKCDGDIEYKFLNNMDGANTHLYNNGYTTLKIFFIKNPHAHAADNLATLRESSTYDWSTIGYDDPVHANCLTVAVEVLEAYGVEGLPALDWLHRYPKDYYNSIEVSSAQPTQSYSMVDAFSIGFPEGSQATPQVTLTLYVHDGSASGPIIRGAQVTGNDESGNSFEQTTDNNGYVTITGYPGTWHFSVSANGYETRSWSQAISETDTKDAYLQKEQQSTQSSVVGKWDAQYECECVTIIDGYTDTTYSRWSSIIEFYIDHTFTSQTIESYYLENDVWVEAEDFIETETEPDGEWTQYGDTVRLQYYPQLGEKFEEENGDYNQDWQTEGGTGDFTINGDTMNGTNSFVVHSYYHSVNCPECSMYYDTTCSNHGIATRIDTSVTTATQKTPTSSLTTASTSGDVSVTLVSQNMRGYDVYVDDCYFGTEGQGGDTLDGIFKLNVIGGQSHEIKVWDGEWFYGKPRFYERNTPVVLKVEPQTPNVIGS
jgi:hypothetical protein